MERQDRTAARLCDELGIHLWQAGDYSGARLYLERAVALHAEVSGAEHQDTAQSLNILGVILSNFNDFEGARPFLERALAIREKVLGRGTRTPPKVSTILVSSFMAKETIA
jgi:Flp pilus assembly protein TadD